MAPEPLWNVAMAMTGKLLCAAVLCALTALPAAAQERSPIVWNHDDNEVGVIQHVTGDGDFIMLPTKATLDLGYYDVRIPRGAIRPRPAGGWEIALTNQQIAYLPPVPHQFFMPSGD
jgi:hypothetical protein